MEHGEIYSFDVQATCPCCTNQSEVTPAELIDGKVECQHCDEVFKIILER